MEEYTRPFLNCANFVLVILISMVHFFQEICGSSPPNRPAGWIQGYVDGQPGCLNKRGTLFSLMRTVTLTTAVTARRQLMLDLGVTAQDHNGTRIQTSAELVS